MPLAANRQIEQSVRNRNVPVTLKGGKSPQLDRNAHSFASNSSASSHTQSPISPLEKECYEPKQPLSISDFDKLSILLEWKRLPLSRNADVHKGFT